MICAFAGALHGCARADAGIQSDRPIVPFQIRAGHPRVWLTPDRIARLRQYAARKTVRWQRVEARANEALSTPDETAAALPALGLAYQVTGKALYCGRAVQLLARLTTPDLDLSGDHYYSYRFDLRDIVAGYDWCHAALAPDERARVARWLMDRADQVWPETHPSRRSGWAVNDPANNYYWGFMMTWAAGLAAWGEDAGASAVSGSDRPMFHVRLALTKWNGPVRHLLEGWGRGGVFAESTNYDAMISLARLLDAHFTATGQNLAAEDGLPFVRDNVLWRLHSTVPTRDHVYPLGDQPRVSLAELSAYDRQRLLPLLRLLPDARLRAWGQYWLQHIDPPVSEWGWVVAWEFLDYDEDAPAEDYGRTLGTSYFAPGPGVLLARSSWAADATYTGIWSGPLRESHQSRDANGFKIWKGEWLAGDASIWSHSGILGETHFHNNITVGGQEQTWVEPTAARPEEGGGVVAVESAPTYHYFAGQAAPAYRPGSDAAASVLKDYLRRFVYLPEDEAFVVYDRIQGVRLPPSIEWHLHTKQLPLIEGRTWRAPAGRWALHGQSMLPLEDTVLRTADIRESADASHSSYSLDVVSLHPREREFLLNVLYIRPAPAGSPERAAVQHDRLQRFDGVVAGGSLVLIAKSDTEREPLDYEAPSGLTQHLVIGVRPATAFRITAGGGADAPRETVASSSAAGVLRIVPAAGERLFGIHPAAAPAPHPGAAPAATPR